MENNSSKINVWIEKTIVKGRKDRIEGERAIGKALWSPKTGSDGRNTYKNMLLVKSGDLILHLIDNSNIAGLSIVADKAIDASGISGTPWDVPSYMIKLKDYISLDKPVERTKLLNDQNKVVLNRIATDSEVFYNNNLTLRQGGYLSPCPIELLSIINDCYKINSKINLPFIDKLGIKLKRGMIYGDKQIPFSIQLFQQKTTKAGLIFSPQLIQRFIASLCTKPFVICSGLSGSGKTKLAQAFAQWICYKEAEGEKNEQYCIVPVGADWTNREPLLGYPNALQEAKYVKPENGVLDLINRARLNETKPYFLILDEMNLSHVERYFADFLSTMESGDAIPLHTIEDEENGIPKQIKLPKNLFIIGTVNIDETTYMFSPKVLDRANTIEFRLTENDLKEFIASDVKLDMDLLKGEGAGMGESFVAMATQKTDKNLKEVEEDLLKFFKELKKSGTEFGYRSASEMGRLMFMLKELDEKGDNLLDIAIMQKLLPKLHGSRNKLTKVLPVLGSFCLVDNSKIKEDYLDKFVSNSLTEVEFKADTNIKYKISFEKICRMYKNAVENGFASFAEA
jgi:DNA polymerase III delta prime subunit